MDISKFVNLIIGIVVALALIPVAIVSVNALLPNLTATQAVIVGLVPLLLILLIVVAIVAGMKFKHK
jgi:hypothetical protein